MKHISDHILEVYALNRHGLSMEVQLKVYQHIETCSECRQVLSYLCSIWRKDIHLVFEAVNGFESDKNTITSAQGQSHNSTVDRLVFQGSYVTESSIKKLGVTKSLSDSKWFIHALGESEFMDPVSLAKLSLIKDWIILQKNNFTEINGLTDSASETISKSAAIYKISQDIVLPTDEYMIHTHQNVVLIDTHRSELNTAILEKPEEALSQLESTSGTFEVPLALWTSTSRMHLFSI